MCVCGDVLHKYVKLHLKYYYTNDVSSEWKRTRMYMQYMQLLYKWHTYVRTYSRSRITSSFNPIPSIHKRYMHTYCNSSYTFCMYDINNQNVCSRLVLYITGSGTNAKSCITNLMNVLTARSTSSSLGSPPREARPNSWFTESSKRPWEREIYAFSNGERAFRRATS